VQPIRDMNIDWRLHIVTWAASQCLHLEGDFVECGVWWGWLSRAMCHDTNFGSSNKSFHLFDSGGAEGSHDNYQLDIFESVQARFKPYSDVKFHRGMVPDVLKQADMIDRIAYLSLGMNGGIAERQALEVLYSKVVKGGVIYLDDYGWNYPILRTELADFLKDKPEKILHFPCGSSIIIKL